ncbi:unnamed protein product, partial [Sphacelaria rigidula]
PHVRSSINHSERRALSWLKTKPRCTKEVVIKNTDKNSGCAVIGKEWYMNECYRQLNDLSTYRPISAVYNI